MFSGSTLLTLSVTFVIGIPTSILAIFNVSKGFIQEQRELLERNKPRIGAFISGHLFALRLLLKNTSSVIESLEGDQFPYSNEKVQAALKGIFSEIDILDEMDGIAENLITQLKAVRNNVLASVLALWLFILFDMILYALSAEATAVIISMQAVFGLVFVYPKVSVSLQSYRRTRKVLKKYGLARET